MPPDCTAKHSRDALSCKGNASSMPRRQATSSPMPSSAPTAARTAGGAQAAPVRDRKEA